jgi:aspartokinase-like uncharacterized kinase
VFQPDPATTHRVAKLGGSLLRWDGWQNALRIWLDAHPIGCAILITGGGAEADEVRARQHEAGFGDEEAHWLAVDAMTRNANLVSERLAIPLFRSWEDCAAVRLSVLDVQPYLRRADGLPADWTFTSDSIAAWLATEWQRHLAQSVQLVMLKSRDPKEPRDLASWAANAYVDAMFPRFAHCASVTWANLRHPNIPAEE